MELKAWWKSKTLNGLGLMVLGALTQHFGPDLAPQALQGLATAAGYVVQAVGLVLGIVGRLKARTTLTGGGIGAVPLVLLLAMIALGASGCAKNIRTVDNYDQNGVKTSTVTTEQTDAASHNEARRQIRELAALNQKPIGKIIIPAGASLTAQGGDITFEVAAPLPDAYYNWTQYKEPWLEGLQTAGGVMTTGILGYILGFGDNFQRGSTGPTTYTNQASGNSGINAWSPSGVASPNTVTPAPVIVPPVITGAE